MRAESTFATQLQPFAALPCLNPLTSSGTSSAIKETLWGGWAATQHIPSINIYLGNYSVHIWAFHGNLALMSFPYFQNGGYLCKRQQYLLLQLCYLSKQTSARRTWAWLMPAWEIKNEKQSSTETGAGDSGNFFFLSLYYKELSSSYLPSYSLPQIRT